MTMRNPVLVFLLLVLLQVLVADGFFLSLGMSAKASSGGSGWGNANWNWGSPVGEAHNVAGKTRAKLRSNSQRTEWLLQTLADPEAIPFEEVKMVLALRWQMAAREGIDGGASGYAEVLENMRQCKYEVKGGEEALAKDMDERIPLVPFVDVERLEAFVYETVTDCCKDSLPEPARVAAVKVLVALEFLERGC